MPKRYDQQKLASAAVGTPGVDPTAGAAAKQISQMAEAASVSTHQSAMRMLQGAEQDFRRSQYYFGAIMTQKGAADRALKQAQTQLELQNIRSQFGTDLLLKRNELVEAHRRDPESILPQLDNYAQRQAMTYAGRASDPKMQAYVGKLLSVEATQVRERVVNEMPRYKTAALLEDWHHTEQNDLIAARQLGAAGDIKGLFELADRGNTPEAVENSALVHGADGYKKLREKDSKLLTEGIMAHAFNNPAEAAGIAKQLNESGRLGHEQYKNLQGELEKIDNKKYQLDEMQRKHDLRQAKEEFTTPRKIQMFQAINSGNQEEIESVLSNATANLASAERDGAPPHVVAAMSDGVNQLYTLRNTYMQTKVYEPARLAAMERSAEAADRSAANLEMRSVQASDSGRDSRASAMAAVDAAGILMDRKGVSLRARLEALDEAQKQLDSAAPILDLPGRGEVRTGLERSMKKYRDLLNKSMQQTIDKEREARSPVAGITDAVTDFQAELRGDNDTLVTNTWLRSPILPGAYAAAQKKVPGLREDEFRIQVAQEFLRDIEDTLRERPDIKFKAAKLTELWNKKAQDLHRNILTDR